MEVAKGDTSAGWVCGLIASHFWLICLFSPEVQEEIWGDDPAAMMSSSFAPSQATCERVDGGYRIRGRWPWSSGSKHCTWAMVGIVVPPSGPNEMPDLKWGLLPQTDYRVDDDWLTVGMRGTGSNTLIVDDAFVPDYRCINPWDVSAGNAPGVALNPSPLYRLPFGPALVYYLSAPALGTAERTLDDWVTYMKGKRAAFTGAEVGKQQPTLIRAGHLSAMLESARLLMTTTPRRDRRGDPARVARHRAARPFRPERDLRRPAVRRRRRGVHAVQRGNRAVREPPGAARLARTCTGWPPTSGSTPIPRTAPTGTCSSTCPSHRPRCCKRPGGQSVSIL